MDARAGGEMLLARISASSAGDHGSKVGARLHNATTREHRLCAIEQNMRSWARQLKRLIKTPKLTFLDSGLLASLRGLTAAKIAADRDARMAKKK